MGCVCYRYGSYDGLSDDDVEQVEQFLAEIDSKCGASLHSIEYGAEVYFRKFNDFNNLGGDCVDCKVYFTTLEEAQQ